MSHWNAEQYLKFGDERTRSALDLAARVRLATPNSIADLGCGPGNSTQVLRARWPDAHVIGVDNSPEMIEEARRSFASQSWLLADIVDWTPADPVDLVYSNAALQWLANHDVLVQRLFSIVAPGGVLAFQIPSRTYATVRTLIHEISMEAGWSERLERPRDALTMEYPSFYYDVLASEAASVDIWETEYCHVLDSKDAIVEWIASTGLQPFLEVLDTQSERHRFTTELRRRVSNAYETRENGKVLFPFRRTFVVAYR